MMSDTLNLYFEALERLKKGRPTCVPKGTRITNDAVAIEAGRSKGSIKKSRPVFSALLEAIAQAADEQAKSTDETTAQLISAKAEAKKFRKLWEETLGREVSLLREVYALKTERGENVIDLRGQKHRESSPSSN
jgi:hypothetical protein